MNFFLIFSNPNFHFQLLDWLPPPLIVTSSTKVTWDLPQGSRLSVFAIGGGGADGVGTAGSSGFFKHTTVDITQTQTLVIDITIGLGGRSCCNSGQATTVESTLFTVTAQGGGQGTGTGWSGGNSGTGGYNGQYGSGEQLPSLCQVTLTPGAAGDGGNHGGGGGGVIVNGQKPSRLFIDDGEGYGAGGGEDHRNGYAGVVVLTFC